MPQSLRSILGSGNRIRKPSRAAATRPTSSSTTPSSSPRKKPTTSPRRKPASSSAAQEDGELFPDRLEDAGLASLLATDLTLRDAVQAMRYIRAHMFTPVPETGLKSTRRTELLRHRATMPPVVTSGHLHAILTTSPTRVEREVAELIQKRILRRVRVERRGGGGEALIETALLSDMLANSSTVSDGTRAAYLAFLEENPAAQVLGRGRLEDAQIDELVRAGFLTSAATRATPATTLHVRPEDRTTLTSIQRVSQFASGTVSAVGGRNAVHMAGGSGITTPRDGATSSSSADEPGGADYRIAVPGHGRHLKLADAAADWLRDALGRTKWGEGTEGWLRERFEGGGLYGPRWKEMQGVEWAWALGEAVGLGVVEVFQTGSVGRGVRALGG